MFKGPGKIVRDNKSLSYPVFELTGVNCILLFLYVRKQTFRKLYGYITRELLGLRMRNFQDITFT